VVVSWMIADESSNTFIQTVRVSEGAGAPSK
jgi:hypothetical protein